MFNTLILILIVALLCLVFLVSSTFIVMGVWGLYRSPHRSKLFLSYSHKDTEIAQRIMNQLNMFRFRVWIDLGIEIPADKLEIELSNAVKECEIFILLASKSSQGSSWVQFEIEEAKKMPELRTAQFRDTIVLALDDWGFQIYERIKELNETRLEQFNASLEWTELSSTEKHLSDILARGARKVINPQPSFSRVFAPTIKIFDLRSTFEPVIEQLAQYLSNNTQIFQLQSTGLTLARIFGFLFWGFGMLSSGLILLLILVKIIRG